MTDAILDTPVLGFADVVLDFFNSGEGPINDVPYGGTFNPITSAGSFPVEVSLAVALGDDPNPTVDFVSLPTGSFITVGFLDEVVVDGPGDDIFITEIASNGERADVFVGNGSGAFTRLGSATGGDVASFDLADIEFEGFVTEVRVLGLNDAGGSPGYDLVNVRALTAGLVDLSGPNEFEGSDGPDTINLGRGGDIFRGGQGADVVIGARGPDQLFGQRGADLLEGRLGPDALFGGNGIDTLLGGIGADTLFGGRGNDEIAGGRGPDMLFGGLGADRFLFGASSGNDELHGFVVGIDDFVLRGDAAFRAAATITAQGTDDTLVRFGGSSVLLVGVDAEAFRDADYLG